jgi:2-C-methyl-D-erythritol 4-phosphate cytidylyltransferase
MNTAIIVAAGSGTRFGANQAKQFVNVLGKPLIVQTLEKFEICPAVDAIVLVLDENVLVDPGISELVNQIPKIQKIVAGGATRAESVRNGFLAVPSATAVVAVHDGARPLVSVAEIASTIEKAAETGAACLVGEVTDTIKMVRGDEIAATLDRNHLRRALTPQAFRVDVLRRAFEIGDLTDAVTDECYLVEKLGYPITFVEGNSRNIKVTRPEDLLLVELLLEKERREEDQS